jgi:hypothetical protein
VEQLFNSVVTIPLQKLIDAMNTKPDGWYADVISHGTVRGDWLHISRGKWMLVSAKSGQFGDVVGVVAKPIAKAIGKDPACSGCARRGKRLNRGGALVT